MKDSLQGRVAWITGGGSGIGLAGAIELIKAGAHVVISGRNAATNSAALAQLQALGSAEAVLLDVADKYVVQAVGQQILSVHGRIDILVNSAGINVPARSLDVLSFDSWDDVVNINLNGLFYCVRAVLPAMRAQGDGLGGAACGAARRLCAHAGRPGLCRRRRRRRLARLARRPGEYRRVTRAAARRAAGGSFCGF